MVEPPDTIFAAQQTLVELLISPAKKLGARFSPYEVKASIAATGKKKPRTSDAARWFRQVRQTFSVMEDPAEDVFVTRVHVEEKNYRVLEGWSEAWT